MFTYIKKYILSAALICQFLLIFNIPSAYSQEHESNDFYSDDHIRNKNYCYSDSIRTTYWEKDGKSMMFPLIDLDNPEPISFHFDYLADAPADLSYTILHCDEFFRADDLFYSEYLNGFEENPVPMPQQSFNTYTNYYHYALQFPNQDIEFKISGNYILLIFESGFREHPLVSSLFSVFENRIVFKTLEAVKAINLDYSRSHQQVNFSFQSLDRIDDPYRNLRVVAAQNGRLDNAIHGVQPRYINGNLYDYTYENEFLFPALGEFRSFNSKDIRFASEGIRKIEYRDSSYWFILENEDVRQFKQYKYKGDLDGLFKNDVSGSENPETDADYVWVHFNLPYEAPLVNGDVYVFAALSGWDFRKNFKMTYNFDRKSYELLLKLKQGYYNYQIAYVQDDKSHCDFERFEGSHYETGNEYTVFVYYRDNTSRYDKLIGVSSVHTQQK